MHTVKVKGSQKFMGVDVPIVEGGFGENCRVITAKTIAKIHKVRMNDVQALINQNIDEFEFGIDLLDLCEKEFKTDAIGLGLITSNRQKHCYILSEQGYMLLVCFMKSPKAKEIRRNFRKEYFVMRDAIKNADELKAKLLLEVYNGGQDAVIAAKQVSVMEVQEATNALMEKINQDKPYTDFGKQVSEAENAISVSDFSKILETKGVKIGSKKLFAWLREKKYLTSNNIPYQKYINSKYFQVIEVAKMVSSQAMIFPKTLITGKGQIHLFSKLCKEFL